jgi:hypothetical protein
MSEIEPLVFLFHVLGRKEMVMYVDPLLIPGLCT